MSRASERASERANVTAGGCLRNPLSCYTAPPPSPRRPSIAARTKNAVPCLGTAPRASGVNILSTLFFHRTSRSHPLPPSLPPCRPFWSFRVARLVALLPAKKPLLKGMADVSYVHTFIRRPEKQSGKGGGREGGRKPRRREPVEDWRKKRD